MILDGFAYRKSLVLSHASGAVTDYQIKITVNRSTGSDSGAVVYVGTNCEDDYSDIRFTNGDGYTLLDYWIETSDSNSATIWVEFDSIGTGDTTFYLYYGNSLASAVSSGANTFEFFDHFDDSSVGAAYTTDGTISESGSDLVMTADAGGGSVYITSAANYENKRVRVRSKVVSGKTTNLYNMLILSASNNFSDTTKGWRDWGVNDAKTSIYYITNETWSGGEYIVNSSINQDTDTYHVWEICRHTAGTKWYVDGSGTAVKTSTNDPAVNEYVFICRTWGTSSSYALSVDWVTIGKYDSTEPAFGSWGAEESPFQAAACYLHARRDRLNMKGVSLQNSLE